MSSSKYQPVESREGVRECFGCRRGDDEAERTGVEGRLLTGLEGGLIGVVCERAKVGRSCGRRFGDGGIIEIVEPVRPLRTKEVVFMVVAFRPLVMRPWSIELSRSLFVGILSPWLRASGR